MTDNSFYSIDHKERVSDIRAMMYKIVVKTTDDTHRIGGW